MTVAAMVSVNGCSDKTAPQQTIGGVTTERQLASVATTAPTQMSFDVELVATIDANAPRRVFKVHVARQRVSEKGWKTTYSFVDDTRLSSAPNNERRLGRIEVDEKGERRIYRLDGQEFPNKFATDVATRAGAEDQKEASMARRTASSIGQMMERDQKMKLVKWQWLDELIATRSERLQAMERMSKGQQPVRVDEKGYAHIVTKAADMERELEIDPLLGDLHASALRSAGKEVARTTHEYTSTATDLSVRRYSRVEQVAMQGRPARVNEVTLSNIVVDGELIP